MKTAKPINTQKLVLLALLTAIVIILQILAILTKTLLPAFSISLVLMPIVIGAAIIGTYAGGWLGLAFGFAVLISGDAAAFMAINPAATIAVVLLKGSLAGLAAGAVYRMLAGKSKIIAAIASAIVAPVVNTAVFIIGSYLFFLPTLTQWGEAADAANVTAYIFLTLVGINFLIELGINLVLCPTIVRLIQIGQGTK